MIGTLLGAACGLAYLGALAAVGYGLAALVQREKRG